MTSARFRAKRVANYFLCGDDYIAHHERSFDNCWEQGDGNKVASHFKDLYDADEYLRMKCFLSRYFSKAMILAQK